MSAYWEGVVVDVNEPNQSGRVKVRIYGHHDDQNLVPDSALPWAQVVQPPTSAAFGKIGTAPVGLVVGSRVIGFFRDSSMQIPIVIGSMGKAGDPISGSTAGGTPSINIAVGSIPASSRGIANNPYSQVLGNVPPVSIQQIDAAVANVFSVADHTGVVITKAVEAQMMYAKVPTIASVSKSNTSDVLDIIRAADVAGLSSSLTCSVSNLLSVRNILAMTSGLVSSIASTFKSILIAAIKNAILLLAQQLGLFKILNMINQAAQAIFGIQQLLSVFNQVGCGRNPVNQGLFGQAQVALAETIHTLNSATGFVFGVTSAAANITGNVLGSIVTAPLASVATALSPVPPNVVSTVPSSYTRVYSSSDPYPGYIVWTDTTGVGGNLYTLRNGEPNYISAQQHTQFVTQNAFTGVISQAITTGTLNPNMLMSAVVQSAGLGQAFALASVLGNHPSSLVTIAALAPIIGGVVNNVFNVKIASTQLSNSSVVSTAMSEFAQVQSYLARKKAAMLTALAQPLG